MSIRTTFSGLVALVLTFGLNLGCGQKSEVDVSKLKEETKIEYTGGMSPEGTSKEAKERLGLEERLYSIKDFDGTPLFDESKYECYLKEKDNKTLGELIERIEDFCEFAKKAGAENDVNLVDGMGYYVHFILDYALSDVPLDFVKEIYGMRKSNGEMRFDLLNTTEFAKKAPWIDIGYLREISQESRFDNFSIEEIIHLDNCRTPIEKIKSLMDIKRDGKQIIPLRYIGRIHSIPTEQIIETLSLRGNDGGYLFRDLGTIDELDFPWLLQVDVGYVKEAAKRLPNDRRFAKRVLTYRALGIKAEEITNFNDTEKPNALFIYPLADANGAFSLARDWLFRTSKRSYDLAAEIVNNEKDFREAFEKVPGYDLIVVGGHGCPGNTNFGEFSLIPGNSDWLKDALKGKVDEDTLIILKSCFGACPSYSGKGSTAEYLTRMANGAVVYANYGPGSIYLTRFRRSHPFKVSFGIEKGHFNLVKDQIGRANWIYCGRYNSETGKIEQLNPIFAQNIEKN